VQDAGGIDGIVRELKRRSGPPAMKPKSLVMLVLGALSLVWILNPPGLNLDDTIPLIGNLDEAAATTILLACLAYFGLDLTKFFKDPEKPVQKKDQIVDVDSHVVHPGK
jgi:hypothetical protein